MFAYTVDVNFELKVDENHSMEINVHDDFTRATFTAPINLIVSVLIAKATTNYMIIWL